MNTAKQSISSSQTDIQLGAIEGRIKKYIDNQNITIEELAKITGIKLLRLRKTLLCPPRPEDGVSIKEYYKICDSLQLAYSSFFQGYNPQPNYKSQLARLAMTLEEPTAKYIFDFTKHLTLK